MTPCITHDSRHFRLQEQASLLLSHVSFKELITINREEWQCPFSASNIFGQHMCINFLVAVMQ